MEGIPRHGAARSTKRVAPAAAPRAPRTSSRKASMQFRTLSTAHHALPARPRPHGQERAERQVVGQHGVDVGGEELDAGEVPAVEQLGLPRLEPHDGRPPRGPEGVAEHRVHEHGQRAELGVAAAAGEEPHRRLAVLLRRHVRVLLPRLPEPLLHPVHQLLPDPLPPAMQQPLTRESRHVLECVYYTVRFLLGGLLARTYILLRTWTYLCLGETRRPRT